MKLDLQALGTFNRLAREGAEHAAASLGQLTETRLRVETTAINLCSIADLGAEFGDRELVGVRIELFGGLDGTALLLVRREGAHRLARDLPGEGDTGPATGRIAEMGNILIGGFIDGWGDYLRSGIELTPPAYVDGPGEEILADPRLTRRRHGQVFAFTSELAGAHESVELSILLVPRADSFERLVAGPRGGNAVPVPFDKLVVFNQMTKEGAVQASDNVTRMTGRETTVEVSHLSFVPVEDITARIDDDRYAGVVIECNGAPGGYVLVLFEESSARTVAEGLVSTAVATDEMGALHQSAITELGNIVTSGFIDGWANVLGTSIDITPPKFVSGVGTEILDPIAARIGRDQEFAFVIDSTLETTDRQVSCELFALPNERELARALNALPLAPEDVGVVEAKPVPGLDARYEDL